MHSHTLNFSEIVLRKIRRLDVFVIEMNGSDQARALMLFQLAVRFSLQTLNKALRLLVGRCTALMLDHILYIKNCLVCFIGLKYSNIACTETWFGLLLNVRKATLCSCHPFAH